jgi:hypothetical protein
MAITTTGEPMANQFIPKRNPIHVIGPSIAYIPLPRERFTLVNKERADRLAFFAWHVTSNGYVARNRRISEGGPCGLILMHRVLTNPPDELDVDHRNGIKLHNFNGNLRLATVSQNGANRGKRRINTSGFKGVSWRQSQARYRGRVVANGIEYHCGNHKSPEAAARAVDMKAIELFGEFAKLNFPHAVYRD